MNWLVDLIPSDLSTELGQKPSVLCLCSAQQKFLIFSEKSDTPAFVMQPGSESMLQNLKKITSELHFFLPDRIPAPLTIVTDQRRENYLLQRGIVGIPWFTLSQRIGKEFSWDEIVDLSIDALEVFHATTASNNAWTKKISLSRDFSELYRQGTASSEAHLYQDEAIKNYCLNVLAEFAPTICYLQHGDLSVNNFLFRKDSVGIVDFEQFGRAYLPLHDEFLLVDSLIQLQHSPSPEFVKTLWSKILAASRYSYLSSSEVINILLLMHIMWWLGEAEGKERRADRRKQYLQALQHGLSIVSKKPSDFVANLLLMISTNNQTTAS